MLLNVGTLMYVISECSGVPGGCTVSSGLFRVGYRAGSGLFIQTIRVSKAKYIEHYWYWKHQYYKLAWFKNKTGFSDKNF